MANFYIKKIIASGKNKEDSSIEFSNGLNVICGPSDTGKSYIVECIDYLFGNDKIRLDKNTGYDCIKMIVHKGNKSIALERKLESTKIKVSSNYSKIESGEYSKNSKNNNLDRLWLSLIDIEEDHQIIKNTNFDKQKLTWRTFLHMFLIKESNVFQEHSVLVPKQNTAVTAALSSLYFLITGQDFSTSDPLEAKKIKDAKKTAVIEYINKHLSEFADKKDKLKELPDLHISELQEKIEDVLEKLSKTEQEITNSINKSSSILKNIYTADEQLAECNMLYNRYQALKTQYSSDIKRLTFIVEGEFHKDSLKQNTTCPFCESNIPHHDEASYIEATEGELNRIQLQLKDLAEAENDLINERSLLENEIANLKNEKSSIESIIKKELKPKVESLKKAITEYSSAIELKKEMQLIKEFEDTMKSELFELNTEQKNEKIEFKIKSHYGKAIIENINKILNKVLTSCKFENYSSSYFDTKSFDIFINGKSKDTFGKGYRAFLNTILAISMLKYLDNYAKYSPKLLIIDSPILSLKERVENQTSDTMKSALFQHLINNQGNNQIIIIENDIPSLDYEEINLIEFTKDPNKGRYGFLHGIN